MFGPRFIPHARLKFFCDSSLNVTEDVVNQVAFDGEGYEKIKKIMGCRWNESSSTWELHVAWRGFETSNYTWEPISQLFADVPVLVKRYVQALPNGSETIAALS